MGLLFLTIAMLAPPTTSRTRCGRLKITAEPPMMSWPEKALAPPAISCGRARTHPQQIEAVRMAARLFFARLSLCISFKMSPFRSQAASANDDHGREDHRIAHAMQTKVYQTVHRDSAESDDRGKGGGPLKPPRALQIRPEPPVDRQSKPADNCQPDKSTTVRHFQVVIVRLLRSQHAGSLMISGNGGPVTAEANPEEGMIGEQMQRVAPDLRAGHT